MAGKDQLEEQRLAALERYDLLDGSREEGFDRITRLTRKILGVPIATISFIDGQKQWFKSSDGLAGVELPRADGFADLTIAGSAPLIVADAAGDPRFAQNPLVVGEPHIRFYAGVPLHSKDGFNIGALAAIDTKPRELGEAGADILADLARLAMNELELHRSATTDPLTALLARRAFMETTDRAISLALRHHNDLSCLVLEVDGFDAINETHGHAAGDRVLVQVAAACQEQLRKTDIVARLAGAQFAAALPHTDIRGATQAAEKLRARIEKLRFPFTPEGVAATASFGVASLTGGAKDIEALLGHAGEALAEAKGGGPNRVNAWRPVEAKKERQYRRIFKGGLILFNHGTSSLECTVRGLSDEGALIDVASTIGIPRQFVLSIKADRFEKNCRILSQTDRNLEAEFY